MPLPEWLQNNLNNEEMRRYNSDPENRSDKTSDPERLRADIEELRRQNNG